MEIIARCEVCGTYLETEKEYSDWQGWQITVWPCEKCLDDLRYKYIEENDE